MTLRLDPKTILFREFGGLEPTDPDWLGETAYWEDFNQRFFASNGLPYGPTDSNVDQWLSAPDRAPFACMARELLPELSARTDLSDVDLVLLAHWLPDIHLGTSVTNYAQHQLGLINGFGFAISDRGRSAPLFALHCASRYLNSDRRRAILMVMDQKHLLYRSPLVEALAPANSATVLVLDRDDAAEGLIYAGYRHCGGITSASLGAAIALICADFEASPSTTTLIADPATLAHVSHPGPVLVQDPRLLCSAPFALLAQAAAQSGDILIITHEQNELCAVLFKDAASNGAA